MKLHSPLSRVRGLGSAKDGTHHWWLERISALALVPLCIWFVYSLMDVIVASDQRHIAEWLAGPIPAMAMLLFIGAMFFHSRLGIQVIIEDYVHAPRSKYFLLLLNSAAHWILALACAFAVLKLHFLDVTSAGV